MRHVSPLRAELVDRARTLGAVFRERLKEGEALRRLPDSTVADMKAAGFFDLMKPSRWGGLEVDPGTFFEVQATLAEYCPSSAWVLGVVGIHPWQLALFPERAQDEVWGPDRAVLIASSYMPVGRVTAVEGGFRLSGRWAFSSGIDHCRWVLLGAMVPPPPGQKFPEMRTFLVPSSDFQVLDTWHVSGLRATGSNDVLVVDAFVPDHRTHRLLDGYTCQNPGNVSNPAPLYRLPFGQIFVRAISTTVLGVAQGALDAYQAGVKGAFARLDGAKLAEETTPREVVARATVTLRELRRSLHAHCDWMMGLAEAGQPLPVEERLSWRLESALSAQRAVDVVETLFHASAARGIALDNPLQRYFQDAQAGRAHYANNPEKPARNLGGTLLGLRNGDYFV